MSAPPSASISAITEYVAEYQEKGPEAPAATCDCPALNPRRPPPVWCLPGRFAFKSWILALYLDVSNVTNRANVEGYAYSYDFSRRAPVTGLPLLPSLGLRASF